MWRLYLFLFTVFFFATPYDLIYTMREHPSVEVRMENVEHGDAGRRFSLLMLGGFAVVTLATGKRRQLEINSLLGWLMILFFALAFASVIWTEETELAMRRLVVLGLLALGALAVAARLSFDEMMRFAVLSSGLTLLLSVGVEIALGVFQPFEAGYQFAGVMHPNGQGVNCAILFIAVFALARKTPQRFSYWLMGVLALGFLFLTRSRTAFGSALVGAAALWMLTASRQRKIAVVLGMCMVMITSYFLWGDDLLAHAREVALLGRDDTYAHTLTKRTPLWQECLGYAAQRPIVGYGYNSFWTPQRIAQISTSQGWSIPHSHSGYLEMLLSLGIIGMLSFVFILFFGVKKSFHGYMVFGSAGYAFAYSALIWLCANMLLEPPNINPSMASFLCMVLLAKLGFVKTPAAETGRPPNRLKNPTDKILSNGIAQSAGEENQKMKCP